MSDGFTYIGLDFETSGLDAEVNAPIQLGMATDGSDYFSEMIGGWNWQDRPWTEDIPGGKLWEWDMSAADVHGIDRLYLRQAKGVAEVQTKAVKWLADRSKAGPAKTIAVGWNIASFDFRFLALHFPALAQRISYRSVDLNALVFGIVEAGLMNYDYKSLKDEVKEEAAERIYNALGLIQNPHDAGWDAVAAMYEFGVLQDIIRGSF